MLFQPIPAEIQTYRKKFILGLTDKQVLFFLVGCLLAIPIYYFGKFFLPESILFLLIVAVVIVPLWLGFCTYEGLPSDEYFKILLNYYRKTRTPLMYEDGEGLERKGYVISKKQRAKLRREIRWYKKVGEH
ncbi:PrgI family protein [Bulleidia sp. zg-1006]|uniref:PrgI family protein n=1 Tax=Bulleidia sp. zg-1006 TaxID=2806552 RepID=UPI0019399D1B|nr:PrgI family protein [Bulleidia sp. zg-1006]QRG86058.1 PrgI family protein [Bulleidia sp. zg-1006]